MQHGRAAANYVIWFTQNTPSTPRQGSNSSNKTPQNRKGSSFWFDFSKNKCIYYFY